MWKLNQYEVLDLNFLENEFKNHIDLLNNINILGGEPSILPLEYQNNLIDLCIKYSNKKPYYITNLVNISPVIDRCDIIISYDFESREYNKRVLNNILSLDKNYAISTILTKYLIENIGANKYLNFIHSLKNCKRADLTLYYDFNKKEKYIPDDNMLLNFVESVIKDPLVNLSPLSSMKKIIDNSLDNKSDFFAIFPNNKYGVRLEYLHGDNGTYNLFDNYNAANEYYNNTIKDKSRICFSCKYVKDCWVPMSSYKKCNGNYKMMELFEDYVHKYI